VPHVVATGDLIEASMVCKVSDQYTFNVLHYVVSSVSAPSVSDVAIAADVEGLFAPLYKAMLADTAEWYGLKLQVIKPTRYDFIVSDALKGVGDLAGEQLPPQIAGLVSLKTGFASKSKRGRIYLPASSEAENDATGRPTGAYIGQAEDIASAYVAGMVVSTGGGSASLNPVIYSRKLAAVFAITDSDVHDSWATIRTRSNIGRLDAPPF